MVPEKQTLHPLQHRLGRRVYHAEPRFLSKIIIDGIELGHGTGSSKKEAEQKAAWAVTQIVGNDDIGDFFMDTIDMSFERYTSGDGKVN